MADGWPSPEGVSALAARAQALALEAGFDLVGIAGADAPPEIGRAHV